MEPADGVDPQIVERLRTVYAVVDELSDVEISARAGVVRLSGE